MCFDIIGLPKKLYSSDGKLGGWNVEDQSVGHTDPRTINVWKQLSATKVGIECMNRTGIMNMGIGIIVSAKRSYKEMGPDSATNYTKKWLTILSLFICDKKCNNCVYW